MHFSGWGLWLETVEVTEVRILSKTVFEDMQQEFRSNIHKDAEKLKMATGNICDVHCNEIQMRLSILCISCKNICK